MKKIFQKIIVLLIAIITIISFDYWLFTPRQVNEETNQGKQPDNGFSQIATSTITTATSTKEAGGRIEEPGLPDKAYLDNVPFVPQAP